MQAAASRSLNVISNVSLSCWVPCMGLKKVSVKLLHVKQQVQEVEQEALRLHTVRFPNAQPSLEDFETRRGPCVWNLVNVELEGQRYKQAHRHHVQSSAAGCQSRLNHQSQLP